MDELRYRLALAGLLHDIGKFAQRAEAVEFRQAWRDEATRADFRYAHAYLTYQVVKELVPSDWAIAPLAAYHHAPKTADQALIRLADQLSAGERATDVVARDDSDRRVHPKQLHPIFARIALDGQRHPAAEDTQRFFWPLAVLHLDEEVVFPQKTALDEATAWKRYEVLWQAFSQEAKRLKTVVAQGALDLPGYLEALQALMMRYTWAVPSAYWKTVPDVSLYDHSRMTAALAVALSDFSAEEIQALTRAWQAKDGPAWEQPVALLVGGDISGIQDFIYTIAAKGAAKMLRGRSFYLQLLTEAVLRFLLRELDLPYTNVIYSGGGNFYLLAPLSVRERLDDLRRRVSETLWRYHRADLYLALGSAEVPLSGFTPGMFPRYWGRMHADMQERKQRRYLEWGEETFHARVFTVPENGGNPKDVCSVCGSETRKVEHWDEWEGQERICTLCRSFAETLGGPLARSHQVRWRWIEPQQADKQADQRRATWRTVLAAFGAQVVLDGEQKEEREQNPAWTQPHTVWLLDDPEPGDWPDADAPIWLRYSVTQIPYVRDEAEAEAINAALPAAEREDKKQRASKGKPKTFSHLETQTESGFHRLGVLRMDVDHLGHIFREGLGERATLSRLATLSFQMSLFFEGYLERLISGDDPLTGEPGGLARLIYAVYAGGDDLFLIGPWDRMPYLALRIVEAFARYTGGHPALHLSGGMAFIHGKYPIYQAAEDAGEAEDRAKEEGRNRFTFLGRVWTWSEFRDLKARMERLVALVRAAEKEKKENRAILGVLQNLARQAEAYRQKRGKKAVWGPWTWRAAYQLTRMAEMDEARKQDYEQLRDELKADNFAHLDTWAVAARWAELMLRKRPQRKGEPQAEKA